MQLDPYQVSRLYNEHMWILIFIPGHWKTALVWPLHRQFGADTVPRPGPCVQLLHVPEGHGLGPPVPAPQHHQTPTNTDSTGEMSLPGQWRTVSPCVGSWMISPASVILNSVVVTSTRKDRTSYPGSYQASPAKCTNQDWKYCLFLLQSIWNFVRIEISELKSIKFAITTITTGSFLMKNLK